MDDSGNHTVELYIYDLSQGMATMMSQMLLGRQIDGIYHTAVVVFGREFFYGSHGISSITPGTTVLGKPQKKQKIGETFIPYQVFKDYVRGLAESTFRGACYNLLKHNCNTFSEDLCQFLCGTSIPKYILDLPQEILSTPLGQSLAPLIESLEAPQPGSSAFSFEPQIAQRETSPGFDALNTEIEAARQHSQALDERRQAINEKLARKERKKNGEKKHKKKKSKSATGNSSGESDQNSNSMSEAENGNGTAEVAAEMLPSEQALEDEAAEKRAEEERKRARDPPIVFKDIDAKTELEGLVKLVDDKLVEDEKVALEELHQYLLFGEGSWALGDSFLVFVGHVLRDPEMSPETRVHLLRALACCALKDDVILLLHQDRRDHVMMNYAQDIDKHTPEEQQALALFLCNLFENTNASEWLLYISEWQFNNQTVSNIRITTKAAVHCLLATCPKLQDLGSAIVHNLACKDVKTVVFDDISVEISMALLQFFQQQPDEERLFRGMKALSKFVFVSPDIPQLVQMIGPNPKDFKGKSGRVDEMIEIISKKVR
ncbi:uncharacterized protein LOC134833978 [Culicoides brevitarsis]|uniref:uncharacterized protein LOC134833978 n=1 Tax=Culicoides brevitarsis TaxID=469753 RepID=UPI00307B1ED3